MDIEDLPIMAFGSSYLKSTMEEKSVSWITESFSNPMAFYKYIENQKWGKIVTLNYAHTASPRKPFIVIVSYFLLNILIMFYVVAVVYFSNYFYCLLKNLKNSWY